jgi:HPt (histidine-containing phosphotransfer) domain-containing protein
MLKLMIHEIEKACKNLDEFLLASDMNSFYIEVHGIKGALANIGAMELSEKAFDLEIAASKKDTAFCVDNLPHLQEKLSNLRSALIEAFSVISSSDSFVIPPELPDIFERLRDAFAETDLILIDKEVENLNALNLSGILGEEIEKIKDMMMMMNYDEATEQMLKLLDSTQCLDSPLVN